MKFFNEENKFYISNCDDDCQACDMCDYCDNCDNDCQGGDCDCCDISSY